MATRDLVAGEMITKTFLESELEKLTMRLTIRMGTIAALCVGALAAIIKLQPPPAALLCLRRAQDL